MCLALQGVKSNIKTGSMTGMPVHILSCSVVFNSVTLWITACQAPLSMEFFRPEYWSGKPFASPEDLPKPGIELGSPTLQKTLYHLSPQGSPMTNLDSILKSRDVTLLTKVRLVKAMGFSLVMYGDVNIGP